MSRLLHVTTRGYRFIYKTRIKEKQIGWLDNKELKKPRKHVMFYEESLDVMGDS